MVSAKKSEVCKEFKVYILGADCTGWSIDRDREYVEKAIRSLKFNVVENMLYADIIYCVWWNKLDSWKLRIIKKFFPQKKVIATMTNSPARQEEYFRKICDIVDIWVCANTEQIAFLRKNGIEKDMIFYSPFYVNNEIFRKLQLDTKAICRKLKISTKSIEGKILIGSFQRDSLGSALDKPKWQKNPELIFKIMQGLKSSRYKLVLAGPRRHYLMRQLRKSKIPFIYIGDEKGIEENQDDIKKNTLSLEKINMLYNLIDIYIITSRSEGGPKAVIEAALTKTMILSTSVGMASDLLARSCICNSKKEFLNRIKNLKEGKEKIIDTNYRTVAAINSFSALKKRVEKIIRATRMVK